MTSRHYDWLWDDLNDTLNEHRSPESWWLTGKSSGCKGSSCTRTWGPGSEYPGHWKNGLAADEVLLAVSGCADRIAECWGRSCNTVRTMLLAVSGCADRIAECWGRSCNTVRTMSVQHSTVRCKLGRHFNFQNFDGSHTEEARFESCLRYKYFYAALPRKHYDIQTGGNK